MESSPTDAGAMRRPYATPTLTRLGALADLTNKVDKAGKSDAGFFPMWRT